MKYRTIVADPPWPIDWNGGKGGRRAHTSLKPYRVELFSRRHRMGWDVWGNESANTAEMPA